MDKRGSIALSVDLLEVYDQFRWIVLGICEDFCAKEGDDMIGNDLDRLITEVGVIDSEVCIKPLHFVWDEFTRDEPLRSRERKSNRLSHLDAIMRDPPTLAATFS